LSFSEVAVRLIDINIEGFKGVRAEFDEFAPAMVLFGPNELSSHR
jgi:hypothetical protein